MAYDAGNSLRIADYWLSDPIKISEMCLCSNFPFVMISAFRNTIAWLMESMMPRLAYDSFIYQTFSLKRLCSVHSMPLNVSERTKKFALRLSGPI